MPGPKRIALFLDGTWNTVNDDTNVWRLKSLCSVDAEQICYYSAGVGTARGERLIGGMFGWGLDDEVIRAYQWLVEQYNPEDRIFIFGFSRGAYTARSLSGFISKCGLLKPGAPISLTQLYKRYRRGSTVHTIRELKNVPDEQLSFEDKWLKKYSMPVPIWFQGVWDTVGALGVRQRNLRELLLNPRGTRPRETRELEQKRRGELRWNEKNRTWEVFIPAVAIKNGGSSFFNWRPYHMTLPDREDLYWWIDRYIEKHRKVLLKGHKDPGTFFVRTMWGASYENAEFNVGSFYSQWKVMIQHYGIYNPYTKRGAIEGLLPHGPHCARDVLATHLLKTTGSYELASFAVQDSLEAVMRHYARFLPHEKVARAAIELNKVWRT